MSEERRFPSGSIAIIGFAGRFPGAAGLPDFWKIVREGVEVLEDFDERDLDQAGVPHELRAAKAYVRRGVELEGADLFDAAFFGYSPREAQILDPQQRLFLECSWEALEHAGVPPGRKDISVGVYGGAGANTYLFTQLLRDPSLIAAVGGYQLMLANEKDFLCTRVSYKLDLRGPSMAVQSACSTSLVAVSAACGSLQRGECDVALAGGVSVPFPQRAGYLFQEGMILSGIKLISRGKPIRSVFDILTSNCRMPDFLTGDLWAGVASVRVGERRVLEIADKYGKAVFLHAVEEYLNYGERVSLNALKRLPKGKYSLVEEQDNGPAYAVTVEIGEDEFIIDLTGSPDQDNGPFNMSQDEAVTACQIAFKGVTSPEKIANGGTFRPLKVITRRGSVFDPNYPAAQGIYYELTIRLHDLIIRCLAQHMPEQLPAGSFASVCGTLFGGTHPDTGRAYAVIEPELGGWGGSMRADGNSGQFCGLHGETYNCPAEVAEARYGVTVDYLSFHDEEGGAGLHRGGKGVRIDYRIKSDNAWLTVAYTRDKVPPWPLRGGYPGSPNHILIVRKNGEKERYSVISGMTLNTDDVIQVMTGTGAGWGDPRQRSLELVQEDLKNGYINEEQAKRYYGLGSRAT